MADVKKIADEIHESVKNAVAQAKLVDRGDGFDIKDIRAILATIDLVLAEVEKRSKDTEFNFLSGDEKKEVAIDVLTRLLDFDIPWIPGFLESTIKTKAINFIIDYSIEFLNKKLGKTWLQ